MSSKLIKRVAVLIFVAFAMASCTKGLVNPDFTEKLDWSKQQGFVLPIDIHGFNDGAKGVLLATALVGGLAAATLDKDKIPRWISLQAAIVAPPFSSNLSHSMTWNVRHMVDFHKTWDPNKDLHGSSLSTTAQLVKRLIPAVNKAMGKAEKMVREKFKKPDFKITFKPRFLVCAHIDSAGIRTIAGKGINSAQVRACMYDGKTNQYISYVEYKENMPYTGKWLADKGILIAKFTTVGDGIIKKLTADLPQAKK